MNYKDPADRLETAILKLAQHLKDDASACDSFHKFALESREQYHKQSLELEKFIGASPQQKQKMIDGAVQEYNNILG